MSAQSADVELVGLYWTLSGPVEVHVGREWSLFDWADRCAEARKVGFSGIGIWHADLEHVLETRSLAEMKQIFDDNGLRNLELEFIMDWFLDPGDERRTASDAVRELLFSAAAELDAHHIKIGNIPGTPCELPQLTERFAELCAEAAERTNAKIVYEFMPFDVNVRSVAAALEVVAGAGAENGGIAIDTWHMSKLGIAPDELRQIPIEYLSWVELSDGLREDMDDLDRGDGQPPPAAGRGRVRPAGLHRGLQGSRLLRALGRRGALGRAAQPVHRRDLPSRLHHHRRANSKTRGAPCERA